MHPPYPQPFCFPSPSMIFIWIGGHRFISIRVINLNASTISPLFPIPVGATLVVALLVVALFLVALFPVY